MIPGEDPMVSRRTRWLRRGGGLAIAVLAFVLVVHNQHAVGIARDETTYMRTGSQYARWWMELATGGEVRSQPAIDRTFGGAPGGANNSEHPPLVKTLMGFSEHVFHDKLGWTDEVTAYRLPGAALNALLVFLVFVMTCAVWGVPEAILAALLATFLPRAFFHAGLGCFDTPIAALWFATVYAYWRALARRRWVWAAGLVFGLALATKHNALLLPFALGLHYLIVAILRWRRGEVEPAPARPAALRSVAGAGYLWRRALRRLGPRPSLVLALAVLAPLVLFAMWPWLWLAPFANASKWIGYHLHHVHYNFEYLGHNWNAPPFPWHVALVTTLFTVPTVTLASAAIGTGVLAVRARRGQGVDRGRAPGLLLLLSAAASIGPFMLGSTPIFGAEKHWAPAITSLCIVAGVGAIWAARAALRVLVARFPRIAARERVAGIAACAALGTAVVTAAAIETFHAQPYALSSYTALAGGAPGGADLGMNRQYWGVSAYGVLPYLRAHAPRAGEPAAPVYSHDASMAWDLYQRHGELPRSLPDSGNEVAGVRSSKWAIVIHERHFNRHDYLIWDAYGTVQPVYVLRFDGVPLVSVYRRP